MNPPAELGISLMSCCEYRKSGPARAYPRPALSPDGCKVRGNIKVKLTGRCEIQVACSTSEDAAMSVDLSSQGSRLLKRPLGYPGLARWNESAATARDDHRVLRSARTLADLEGASAASPSPKPLQLPPKVPDRTSDRSSPNRSNRQLTRCERQALFQPSALL